jgi:hypothetical protein
VEGDLEIATLLEWKKSAISFNALQLERPVHKMHETRMLPFSANQSYYLNYFDSTGEGKKNFITCQLGIRNFFFI